MRRDGRARAAGDCRARRGRCCGCCRQSPAARMDTLNDPHRLHSAAVHVPIAASALGVLLIAYLAVTRGAAKHARWCIVILYVAAFAASFIATRSGESANGANHRLKVDAGK